ncbi:MAG TPA: site-specific integrase [Candidatus Dormibacteraeota bacterium]|nr:site-specific integrase [Candidatus Dormibacteraeota bacterium]
MPRQKRGRSRAGDGTLYRTTIQASSGRRRHVWVAEVQWTAPDGRRFRKSAQRVTRQGSLTQLHRLRDELRDMRTAADNAERTITIAEALDAFVAARAPRWRPSTQRHYRAAIRLCLTRWLKRRVVDLRREDVSALLASAHSATLARAAYMLLKAAVRPYARFMINDPFLFAAMPNVRHLTIQPLDASEVRVFLDVARGERLYALFALALAGGLRLGELLALRWRCVGLDYVVVTGSLDQETMTIHDTKTRASRRRVDLPPGFERVLRRHRDAMRAEGLGAEADDLVFQSRRGAAIRAGKTVRKSFRRILKTAKLRPMRFHDLRHTHASLLLAAGVHPKIVQERLGHASIKLTMDTYSHVMPSMQREAALAVEGLFANPRG